MNGISKKDTQFEFLSSKENIAIAINQKANELLLLLTNFDTSSLPINDYFKGYFKSKHLGQRLIFSIQSSAQILYQSIKKTGKPINEITIVDYGAGLGTLYMLGGLLGFKRISYNDYLPDWKDTAKAVCDGLNIPINDYITGDIDEVINYAEANSFTFDIIASRNVIEHIYSLPRFYSLIHQHNKYAVIFSTTTANYHNPAMHLRHYLIHNKVEKTAHFNQRKEAILKRWPTISEKQLDDLAKKTRGKAMNDFDVAISQYQQQQSIEPVPFLRSNTCDCLTGYWSEHLLKKEEYQYIITTAGFKMEYSAGFWDTHYKSAFMNMAARLFNRSISLFGKKGYILSPFVNVLAYHS
jgi:2-polyprenyl-3-methyl-5-hydroxy-6-metoxy-1,4-benzoquinol methylase